MGTLLSIDDYRIEQSIVVESICVANLLQINIIREVYIYKLPYSIVAIELLKKFERC
jgi:hypothetical protein